MKSGVLLKCVKGTFCIAPVSQPEVGGNRGTIHQHIEEDDEKRHEVGAGSGIGDKDRDFHLKSGAKNIEYHKFS